jgi:hypothetical protein
MESRKNKSRTYFVPLLHEFVDIHKSLLVDTYLYDINKPDFNLKDIHGLFVMFRWSDNDVHRMYEQKLLESQYTRDHYDIDVHNYMVFIKFPVDILIDVDLLLKGKFSKISKKSKISILKYWGLGQGSDLYGTLYQTEDRRKKLENYLGVRLPADAELASVIETSSEVFDKTNKESIKN